MALPGNFALGYLEEDNPLKAYFRFCPLFLHNEGKYVPFENTKEQYPLDGFIRIVPDKNESNHFKIRMRQLGRYCLLDLRKHLGPNDKIRPNKNYSPERSENNAYIVYSDVICQLPENQIAEIVETSFDADAATISLAANSVFTACAYILNDGMLTGPWSVQNDDASCILTKIDNCTSFPMKEAEQRITEIHFVSGESTRIFVPENEKGFYPGAVIEPSEAQPAEEPAAVQPVQVQAPTAEIPAPVAQVENIDTPAAETPAPAPVVEPVAAPPVVPAAAPAPAPEAKQPAPWISRDPSLPRTVSIRQGGRQTGLNPTRGLSLKEIVDDQWRKIRYENLGHPIPTNVSAVPVENPADAAIRSMRCAWQRADIRETIVKELVKLDALDSMVLSATDMVPRSAGTADSMTDIEAARMKIAMEIDALKKNRQKLREEALDELRASRNRELASLEEAYQQSQRNILAKCSDNKGAQVKVASPSAGQLISDLRAHFAETGYMLDNDEAVNLLAILSTGSLCLVTGPTGCGKTAIVELLAQSLGLKDRFLAIHAPASNWDENRDYHRLNDKADMLTPRMLLLDDANTKAPQAFDPVMETSALHPSLSVFATLQDGGLPVEARVFDRAFTLRLEHTPLSAKPACRKSAPVKEEAVSLSALQLLFAPTADIPAEIEERLLALRTALAKVGVYISQRALNGMWDYLARILPYVDWDAQTALDRALSQRAIPAILASASLEALVALPDILASYPRSLALMNEVLPLPPL